jgi:UPF0755 protein
LKWKKEGLNQLLLPIFLSLLFLILLGIHLYARHHAQFAKAEKREGQIVRIEPQLGVFQIAQRLKEKGIIRSPRFFLIAAFLRGSATQLKAGDYCFTPEMSLFQVLGRLERGETVRYPATIPEGYSMREIARLLGSLDLADPEKFLRLCRDPEILQRYGIKAHSLEGYLFPDTYDLLKGMKEEEIIERMVHRFFQIFTPEKEELARRMGMGRHQAVTLASLIEAETPKGDERYLVSSVFHRRLRMKMPLQCDPTVLYALSEKTGKRERLTRRNLSYRSSYNTYLHPGLPPGPICSPGAASLEAALAPAPSSYLYFVSKGNGTHYFSSTWTEHSRAVRKYRSGQGGG